MSLALKLQNAHHTLRTKQLYIIATPTSNYQGPITNIPTTAFTQPGGAGKPLVGPTGGFLPASALTGSITFTTSGGTGGGTQAVNMATYTNLTSATPATATAAAVALALALTSGALGTASGSTYTGSISNGVLSIATSKALEVLSITVSSLVQTGPGGDIVNLNQIALVLGQSSADAIGYPGVLSNSEVVSAPAGYPALLIPGPTLATWKLRVFSGIDTELATGAYPADILSSVFVIMVEGTKGRC